MKKLSYKLRHFLIISGVFILSSMLCILCTNKLQFHLILNQQHNAIADIFFKYYTNVGDGAFALVLFPFLLFFGKIKHLFLAIFSCFFGGMLAQFFKRVVFPDSLRPMGFFEQGSLHLVDGVSLHHVHSFPSGHTASAFAFFIFLAFIGQKNKTWQVLCAILAMLVAYSRVYLSQHFISDVVAGTVVGISGFFFAHFTHKKLKIYHLEYKTIEWIRSIWSKRVQILSLPK